MRLPSKLLGRVRVGVGVGAVMLGGCDLVDEAKARVLGSEPAAAAPQEAALEEAPASTVVTEADAPEPMLLGRRGVAGVVEKTVATSQPGARSALQPIADFRRPVEPEGSHAFVPYDEGSGSVATAPPALARPSIRPRPRRRPKPRAAIGVDEPCSPGLETTSPPDREWECLACGRG